MTDEPWRDTATDPPPEAVVVQTRYEKAGCPDWNRRPLMRLRHRWFHPDANGEVYYTPTHWRPLESQR